MDTKDFKKVVNLIISLGYGERDIEVGIVEVTNFLLDGFFETIMTTKKKKKCSENYILMFFLIHLLIALGLICSICLIQA